MTCRENRGSSAWTSYVRASTGELTDQQMLSSFHELQREGADHPAPSREAVVQFTRFMTELVEEGGSQGDRLTAARRTSILNRLQEARTAAENGEGLPTGPQFYAWNHVRDRAGRAATNINQVVSQFAQRTGTSPHSARQEFDRLVAESESGGRAGERLQPTERTPGIPQDPHTLHAVAVMEQVTVAVEGAHRGTQNRRVPDDMFRRVASGMVDQVGYNPENGDCEVEFRSGYRYRMGNVPPGAVEDMVAASNPAAAFARMVRNPDYLTDQADRPPAPAVQCDRCGQFVGDAGCSNPNCGVETVTPVRTRRPRAGAAAALAERQAVYDANTPTVCQGRVTSITPEVSVHDPSPGVRPLESTESVIMSGPFQPSPLDRRLLESGPIAPRAMTQVYLPTGVPGSRAVVRITDQVIGRLDPARPTGLRLLSGTVGCRTCGTESPVDALTCEHAVTVVEMARAAYAGRTSGARVEAVQGLLGGMRTRLQAARNAWVEQNADILSRLPAPTVTARRRNNREGSVPVDINVYHSGRNIENSWVDNTEGFDDEYKAVKERIAAGGPAIVPDFEPWAGASTRKFGAEIEFFIPRENRAEALRAIGAALFDALPPERRPVSRNQRGYGSGRSDTTRWRFEDDPTVDAEIVAPIMGDTPETWEEYATVFRIIKEHGGTVRDPHGNRTAGGHIHVGVGDFDHDVVNHSNMVAIVGSHEDTIYRMSTAPGGDHRGTGYCNPRQNPAGYETFQDMRCNTGHHIGVNWQSVVGNDRDHVELRSFDAPDDLGTLQARVRLACALADTARTAAAENITLTGERVTVGSQRRETGRRRLVGDDWKAATLPTRRLADLVGVDDRLKKQLVGLFAQGSWVRS